MISTILTEQGNMLFILQRTDDTSDPRPASVLLEFFEDFREELELHPYAGANASSDGIRYVYIFPSRGQSRRLVMKRKKWFSLRLACLTVGPFMVSSSVSFLSGADFNWTVFWGCLSFLLVLNVTAADFYESNK